MVQVVVGIERTPGRLEQEDHLLHPLPRLERPRPFHELGKLVTGHSSPPPGRPTLIETSSNRRPPPCRGESGTTSSPTAPRLRGSNHPRQLFLYKSILQLARPAVQGRSWSMEHERPGGGVSGRSGREDRCGSSLTTRRFQPEE